MAYSAKWLRKSGANLLFETLRFPLFIKSIKRSVINIQRSMLGVRCSTFNAYSPTLEDSLFRPDGISYEVSYKRRLWPDTRHLTSETFIFLPHAVRINPIKV